MSVPELTVVLPMPAGYGGIARTLRHLRAQTARERMEVVIMAPACANNALGDGALDGFAAARVLEHDPAAHLAEVRVAGVEVAGAPIVVFAEDHCYPAPGWADALIRAHVGPWAAVGPEFENANPGTALSWADFYLNFGAYASPAPRGAAPGLAWHNTSYKRAVLLECGAQLRAMIECEGVLQDRLRAQGHELWLEPGARVAHVNFSRMRWFIWGHVVGGRLYGAHRVREEHWSVARRGAYVLAGVLTPLARLPRIWRDIQRREHRARLGSMLPALTIGLVAHAAGEIAAYAGWVARAAEQKSAIEFNRHLYVTARDRAEMMT